MVKMPANAGDARDMGLISGSGRSPGVGNNNYLQYSCLENPMDRGAGGLQSMESCHKESDMTKHVCMHAQESLVPSQKLEIIF